MRTCCSSSRSIRAASRRSGSAPSSGGSRRSISSDTSSCLPSAPPSFRPTRRRFRPNSTLPPRRRGRRRPGNPQTSCSSSGCSIYHHQLGALIRQYSDNTEYLCDRLKAISDKRRLDIIKLIKNESLCGQDLAERIGLSPATISHHMSSLVSAGFIHVDKQNPRVSYSINQDFIKSFIQNLSKTLL